MYKIILSCMAFCLSGCIGTKILDREYEKDKPYPDLHSVPDRPAEVDFKTINKEMQTEESEQSSMLKLNNQLREKYIK